MLASAPEGWYDNPDGSPGKRYWDGREWAAHVTQVEAGWVKAAHLDGTERYWTGTAWSGETRRLVWLNHRGATALALVAGIVQALMHGVMMLLAVMAAGLDTEKADAHSAVAFWIFVLLVLSISFGCVLARRTYSAALWRVGVVMQWVVPLVLFGGWARLGLLDGLFKV